MTLTALRHTLLETARSLGATPLLSRPDGTVVSLADGYIPLLVNFSFEDKATKGLRKLQDQTDIQPAEYFSALEMVGEHAALLLAGETGSGKTTFARHLTFRLSNAEWKPHPLARNDHGAILQEHWALSNVLPMHISVVANKSFTEMLEATAPGTMDANSSNAWKNTNTTLLVMLDGIEAAGDDGPALLADALRFQEHAPRIRLLVLGEASVVKGWALPAPFVRHDLLPLLKSHRLDAARRIAGIDLQSTGIALGEAAANPAQFVMALSVGDAGDTAEAITDRWLAKIAGEKQAEHFLCGLGFDALSGTLSDPEILPITRVRQLLAARYLVSEPAEIALSHFQENPPLWTPVIKSLARRLAAKGDVNHLIEALMDGSGQPRVCQV